MEQIPTWRFRHFTAYAVLLSVTLLLFSACGSSSGTRITGSWAKAENQAKQFDRIMILGLSDNVPARAQAEQALAGRLAQEGFQTLEGLTLISPQALKDYNGDREKAKRFFEEHGVDGVIVISVRDVKEEERYVPGTATYTPMSYGYYGRFYSYWYTAYDRVYTPGYYEESLEIFLESNLYDVATEELLWSVQSKTENPESIPELVRAYAEVLVQDLPAKNVIAP